MSSLIGRKKCAVNFSDNSGSHGRLRLQETHVLQEVMVRCIESSGGKSRKAPGRCETLGRSLPVSQRAPPAHVPETSIWARQRGRLSIHAIPHMPYRHHLHPLFP